MDRRLETVDERTRGNSAIDGRTGHRDDATASGARMFGFMLRSDGGVLLSWSTEILSLYDSKRMVFFFVKFLFLSLTEIFRDVAFEQKTQT